MKNMTQHELLNISGGFVNTYWDDIFQEGLPRFPLVPRKPLVAKPCYMIDPKRKLPKEHYEIMRTFFI